MKGNTMNEIDLVKVSHTNDLDWVVRVIDSLNNANTEGIRSRLCITEVLNFLNCLGDPIPSGNTMFLTDDVGLYLERGLT
jgi:hypothetical protein